MKPMIKPKTINTEQFTAFHYADDPARTYYLYKAILSNGNIFMTIRRTTGQCIRARKEMEAMV